MLASALALSDTDLLGRIEWLACTERQASAELVAHLAALELRPSLHAAQGYGTLFAYCTQALRLSEDAACNRIQATRICRRFPVVLELLASGALTLSAIRMLGPHLTDENHETVLARAANRRCEDIAVLVAELAPRPDVTASVRKLPAPKKTGGEDAMAPSAPTCGATAPETTAPSPALFEAATPADSAPAPIVTAAENRRQRPIVQPLAPQRYRVQFTIGQEAHDQLRRVRDLLRREIPSGDAGLIFERALALLHEQVQRVKLGSAGRPRSKPVIRRTADEPRREVASRHIPTEVKRAVWWRDGGQCAFVSVGGHRCTERSFLELHHIHPYAMDGPATVGNISLRCRRHNQYEAELVFGPYVTKPAGMPKADSGRGPTPPPAARRGAAGVTRNR
jgi:hypothetical protein